MADVATSVAFYESLGCKELGRDGDRWAGVGSEHVALSLCGPEDTKRPTEPCFAAIVTDVAAASKQLEQMGGTTAVAQPGSGTIVEDPDGNRIMLLPAPS